VCINISINSREIIRLLKLAGWVHLETRGSHWQCIHVSRAGRVTVPHPKKDVPIGTVQSIEKQSGVILRY
jgi:predicted RNA binding protein YcfA (HicA-like mRNA interferase family)